jgi:hypothetical protein
MMVPDSTKRLEQATKDLADFLQQESTVLDTTGEWYLVAREFLKEHEGGAALASDPTYKKDIQETTNVDDLAPDEAF